MTAVLFSAGARVPARAALAGAMAAYGLEGGDRLTTATSDVDGAASFLVAPLGSSLGAVVVGLAAYDASRRRFASEAGGSSRLAVCLVGRCVGTTPRARFGLAQGTKISSVAKAVAFCATRGAVVATSAAPV